MDNLVRRLANAANGDNAGIVLNIIADLSETNEFAQYVSFVESGGVQHVMNAMTLHPTHRTVKIMECATIFQLSSGDGYERQLVDEGAIPSISSAVERFEHVDARLMGQAMRAFSVLLYDDRNVEQLWAAHVMELALQAMANHATIPGVLGPCLLILQKMCCSPEAVAPRQRLIDAGGIAAVLRALLVKAPNGDNKVQVTGCRVLYNFCSGFQDVSVTARFKQHCVEMGAFETLFTVLKGFEEDMEIYTDVVGAVGRICFQMPVLRKKALACHFNEAEVSARLL